MELKDQEKKKDIRIRESLEAARDTDGLLETESSVSNSSSNTKVLHELHVYCLM